MKIKFQILSLVGITLLFLFSLYVNAQVKSCPKDWVLDGSKWDNYEMGCDTTNFYSGKTSAYLKSVKSKIKGFGSMMQVINAGQYHGKRIRYTAWVKTKDVEDWAGLWMRIDDYNMFNISLSFDNMFDRPIKGTNDWKKYEIVLDVPETSSKILFGAILSGTGKLWLDEVNIEIVDHTIPVTGMEKLPENPSNTGFEER